MWDAGLSDVPTEHILPCLRRAMAHKRDDFMMRTAAILREWDAVKEELRQERETHAAAMDRALMAGHGTLTGRMSLGEWKERHNLPRNWAGGAYPPESDLYGKPVPPAHDRDTAQRYIGPWDPKWYVHQKAPWELYPWVDSCTGERCPGYLRDRDLEGYVKGYRECPRHGTRWNGELPPEDLRERYHKSRRQWRPSEEAPAGAPVDAGAWGRIRSADLAPDPQPQLQTASKAADDPAEIDF